LVKITPLSIDLGDIIRRCKPDKRRAQLNPRPRSRLVSADALGESARPALVLDTNVYIMDAAGRLPPEAQALIDHGLLFHCSVCLGELAVGIANADPAGVSWRAMRDHYAELFQSIPSTRVLNPDAQTWTEAGTVAGILARTQGFQKHQIKECLNDAVIYLTAAKAGLPVLTANRDDFDLVQQIAPEGQFLYFYGALRSGDIGDGVGGSLGKDRRELE
jgi:predicted nucleic acid-binding protein